MLSLIYADTGERIRLGYDAEGRATVTRSGPVRRAFVERAGGAERDVEVPEVVHDGQELVVDKAALDWAFGIGAPVWEETWSSGVDGIVEANQGDWSDRYEFSRFAWEQGTNFGSFGDLSSGRGFNPEPRDVERARLAAAAPELARVLLAIEWQGCQDYVGDGGYRCCPTCRGVAPGEENLTDARDDVARGRTVVGHKPDCALDAVLRKAGVR